MWRLTLKYVVSPCSRSRDDVGQIAERQDIGGAVERHAVLEREPLARFDFVANGEQTAIVDDDLHASDTRFEEENISGPENKE